MQLDRDEARRRLIESDVARLATVRPDGRPHAVPICFTLIDDTVYSAIDEKPKSSAALQRLANIDAKPHASILADHYDRDWTRLWWVRADGTARQVADGAEREQAVAALRAKYPQYAEHRLDGAVIAIEVRSWTGWAAAPGTSPAPGR